MYHYVRELSLSRYPAIKGRNVHDFRGQLEFIRRHHQVVSIPVFIAARKEFLASGEWHLPANALLLTFDDGYSDHFNYVLPLLDEFKMSAGFFPPARPILDRKILDVNKIHLLLASEPDADKITNEIFRSLDSYRSQFQLDANEAYYQRLAVQSRFDSAKIIFIKRLLQRALPLKVREKVLDDLFRKFVSGDESALSHELYMTLDQIKCLVRLGMCVGSHGYSHYWMSELTPDEQQAECSAALEFLVGLGVSRDNWTMCYPYGDSDDSLRAMIQGMGCAAAFTTRPLVADAIDHPLLLPRIDTNDLPVNG